MDSNTRNPNKLNDLYRILGVARNTSNPELRNAYLKLVMQYHPDKNPKGKAKFIDICSAYHILTNPESRKQFLIGSGIHHTEPTEYNDAFSDILSESFRRQAENQRVERLCRDADDGSNLYVHQRISLEDVYLGRELTIRYGRMIICLLCHGDGEVTCCDLCDICQGSGKASRKRRKKKKHGYNKTLVHDSCGRCTGTGRIHQFKQCNLCCGNKYIEAHNLIQVQVPVGGPTGGKIRFLKRGHETRGEEYIISDLIILFHLRHHSEFNWQIDTAALYTHVSISLTEALLGFDRVLLVHLDGRQIKVFQPAGKIVYPGLVMRIPGEGMRFDNKNSVDGDLLIEFNVEFPSKLVLSANMIEQLTSILSFCIPSVNDTTFVRSKEGNNNGVLFGCPTASSSSTSFMPGSENVPNNDSSVFERVIIKEHALDDIDDKESAAVKKVRLMELQGFCLQCGSKPLFEETILDNMTRCCTGDIELVRNSVPDVNIYGIEENDYGEEEVQEENLYT